MQKHKIADLKKRFLFLWMATFGLFVTPLVQPVFAANVYWNGSSTNWGTVGGWVGGSLPTTNDVSVFSSVNGAQTVNLDANRSVSGVLFTNTGAVTVQSGAGINTLTIGAGGLDATAGLAVSHLIKANVALGADQTWRNTGAGSIVIQGAAITNNGHTLTVAGAQSIAVTAAIGGTGGIIKNENGIFALYSASTFSGGVTLNAGHLRVRNGQALGTGTLTINGGNIGTVDSATQNVANAVSVNGNFSFFTPTSASLTLSGAMNLNGAARTITQGLSSNQYINGTISNGGLIKAGTGVLSLGGVNTYTGDTTVSAGTLLLADNSQTAFTIGASGVNNKIGGTGTLIADGDFAFDLTNAGTVSGDSWTIVDAAALNESFGSTFSVVGFTDNGNNTWSKQNGAVTYTFSETTGVLSATDVRHLKLFIIQ